MNLITAIFGRWQLAVMALVLAFAGVCYVEKQTAQRHLSAGTVAQAHQITSAALAAAAAESAYRAKEQEWARRLNGAQDELLKQHTEAAALAAALRGSRLELGGLHDQLASFAATGGTAGDTTAACRRRAETLGALLDEGLRVQEDLAQNGESCESSLRAVLTAWPGG